MPWVISLLGLRYNTIAKNTERWLSAKYELEADLMAHIRERHGRHFVDDWGNMFWINGPEAFCYLSEQRQWRKGLTFLQIIEWKQCAPSGLVSQRFGSIVDACEAFETNRITWSHDSYLHRIGEQMARHRSLKNYRPTYMKKLEAEGAPVRRPPWIDSSDSLCIAFAGPRCIWPDPVKRCSPEPLRKKYLNPACQSFKAPAR